jgi:DNA-binding transcriptional LysR family regulator
LSGFEPAVRDVRLLSTVVTLVGAGLGVSVLPASARLFAGPDVMVLPLRRQVPVVETAVLRRRDDQPSPQARQFLRLALATPEPDVLNPEHARR